MGPDHPRQAAALRWLLLLLFALALVRRPRGTDGSIRPYRVPINRAGSTEVALIPGVGPELAMRIVASRHLQGRFERYRDLQRVTGIGPVLRRKIARYASLD